MKKELGLTSLALLAASTLACTDEVPDGLRRTPDGPGPVVKFDLYHKPLPDVPLPNDVAMWPDPTSRTGVRVNASLVAPTNIEIDARERFNRLEGWGAYGAIWFSVDKADPADTRAAIDLQNMIDRHQNDDYELNDDAVYLVDLMTGIPHPIDLGEGAFQYTVRQKDRYFRNDTRRLEQNLLYDTTDETIDPDTGRFDPARTAYAPQYDSDFDGHLDRPNLVELDSCPNQEQVRLGQVTELERDRCIGDNLLTWYERETDSIIMRPLVPLKEKNRYAVVVTDRLVDYDGNAIKSPFDFVYHPGQVEAIERLQAHLSNPDLASYYGDIGGTGLEHVAFSWVYTTQPVMEDLRLLRDGLYGKGPFASLATEFPAMPEMKRAAGKVTIPELEEGVEEDPNWPSLPGCEGLDKKFFVVDLDIARATLRTLASQAFGFSGPTLNHLLDGFDHIKFIAIGEVEAPFFIQGGPQGTAPTAAFELDYQTGEGSISTDRVNFFLAIPKETATAKQPFPVSFYGHGYTSSFIEHLGFAGELARQGIASVGWHAVFHGLELDQGSRDLANALFKGGCVGPFADAMLNTSRQRDLDGDGEPNSGGDYWTSYLFHTRDVVRQSAMDSVQMTRMFKRFGTMPSNQDYNQDGKLDELLGDFDNDGVADVGGPDNEYYSWGQSLGGILSPFLGALDGSVTAAAPTSGSGGLLDVGVRTFQGGAFEGVYLRNFGPMAVSVPVDQLNPESTKCAEGQSSLRFIMLSVNNTREVEFGCFDLDSFSNGGTVVLANRFNGETRCARMGSLDNPADGTFRVSVPTSAGDELELQLYAEPDAIDTYDIEVGCNVTPGLEHVAIVDEWGEGLIADGDEVEFGDETRVCEAEGGCVRFEGLLVRSGSPLTALVEGFGHIRQTPPLRRLMSLAGHVIDGGDPINMAPYFALRPLLDPDGNMQPATGLLNIVTIGDMNVPINGGIAMARAAGALPFFVPGAEERYPGLADYVTPQELYDQLGGKTPNRFLIDTHVMEGINRLERHDTGNCAPNEVPLTADDVTCHPICQEVGSGTGCNDGQVCNENFRCEKPAISDSDCAQYLYDADSLDEGTSLWGEAEAAMPVRVGRIAQPADPANAEAVWAPRIQGTPFAPDNQGWTADARIVSHLSAYVEPKGDHGFFVNNPCDNFQTHRYLINLIGRFFATSGSDLYYLSHPTSHHCLARAGDQGGCNFVNEDPP